MNKVFLFFVMILLVLVSARSLFCKGYKQHNTLRSATFSDKKKVTLMRSIAKKEHTRLTRDVKHAFSRNIDEVSIHVIVRLLDCELEIINGLLNGWSGIEMGRLLDKKNKLLKASMQTVSFVYEMIMNFATSDFLFDAKRNKIRTVKSSSTLTGAAKKSYLKIVQRILGQYRELLGNKRDNTFRRVFGIQSQILPPDHHNRKQFCFIVADEFKKSFLVYAIKKRVFPNNFKGNSTHSITAQ